MPEFIDAHAPERVSTKVPITSRTGHISILNTKALETVDIEKYGKGRNGSGGSVAIQHDNHGRPNGRGNNLDDNLIGMNMCACVHRN
jgi:predicted amidohydrolase YtcJ